MVISSLQIYKFFLNIHKPHKKNIYHNPRKTIKSCTIYRPAHFGYPAATTPSPHHVFSDDAPTSVGLESDMSRSCYGDVMDKIRIIY
jgi:hypothetical protein